MKNYIKEFRVKQGLSQAALAEAVGTTKRTIYSIEVENKDIHISMAGKLALFFGCGLDDLFDYFPDDIDELFASLKGEVVPAELLTRI